MSTDAVTGRGRDWLHADVEAASRAARARTVAPSVLERMAVVINHLDDERRTARRDES
jgi:hypothetical protein